MRIEIMGKIPNISINHLKLILKPKAYKSLNNFLTGKTGLAREDGDFGVYIWDFEEWCEKYSRSWKNEVYEEDKKRR